MVILRNGLCDIDHFFRDRQESYILYDLSRIDYASEDLQEISCAIEEGIKITSNTSVECIVLVSA